MDRLAEYFTAENYGIFLNISKAEDKIFSGEVEISGKASRADFIKLHSKDLVINKVSAHYDDEIVVLKHELIPGNDELQINFINAETDKKITFDRNNSDDYSKGIKTCDLELDSNILSIKILSDTSSLEIYTNNYKTVLTSNIYPSENENKIEMIATDGEVYISTFKGYSLNTVNQEEKICTM